MSDNPLDPLLAERLIRATRAAQTLSETLWEALEEELSDPREQRVLELSQQLGDVAATVASLAHAGTREPHARAFGGPESDTERVPDNAPSTVESPASASASAPPSTSPPTRDFSMSPERLSPAVLVDELAAPGEPREQVWSRGETPRPAVEGDRRGEDRSPGVRPRIEIKDERGEGGPGAWIGSIGRRLERHEHDSSPFAVLLVELVGIERLRHTEPPEKLSRLMGQVEEALARGLRPADSLTRENAGRYWLLAPQTDGAGAQILAERVARGVRSSASHRGTPLEVAVGIAMCPEDGLQASQLAAHADVELYAARAAGRYL